MVVEQNFVHFFISFFSFFFSSLNTYNGNIRIEHHNLRTDFYLFCHVILICHLTARGKNILTGVYVQFSSCYRHTQSVISVCAHKEFQSFKNTQSA